jgi:hypothetical protein
MNFWKQRRGNSEKTLLEKNDWIKLSKEYILNDNNFNFIALQETSLNMLNDEIIIFKGIEKDNIIRMGISDSQYIYHTNPYKYPDWGLMIISKKYYFTNCVYNNSLAYMCYDFIIDNKNMTIVNVHLQKDYKTCLYHPSLKKLVCEIETIKESRNTHAILLVGDFNASSEYPSTEIDDFIILFSEINKFGFVDCTKMIDINKRSTMLDYQYQNDYVFINSQYKDNILEIKIRNDIKTDLIDHYPIDFKIKL